MSINVNDLHFAYFEEGKETISGLSAEFSEKEITLLTGSSGCGKSTLLYLIAGLYPHNAGFLKDGTITVETVPFAGGDAQAPDPAGRCALVGMLFQNPDLQFCMDTVRNELIFCLENICTAPEEFEDRIHEALEFCGLPGYGHRTLHSLSGGEKQRVALACVYAQRPKWLLLDEPFANIDAASADAICRRLKILHEEKGIGIIAVEHRLEYWKDMADRILVMENGRLRPAGAEETAMEGYSRFDRPGDPGEVVLELKDLQLSFTEVTASGKTRKPVLTGVSASFRRGMIYAVVGESGSGKSSLFGALSGLYPYSGHIYLDGKELSGNRRKTAGKIGFVTQSPQDQFIGGTVRDEVQAAFRKDPGADEKGEAILRSIHLWKYRDISPYMLSQGQQRRLGVAALMAYDCEVLVCDEPTYAQDRKNTMAIMDNICTQAREKQTALLFSTHDRQAAEAYADVILELKGGKLYASDQSVL